MTTAKRDSGKSNGKRPRRPPANRFTPMVEQDFLPFQLADLVPFRRAALERGHSRARVAGTIDMLLAMTLGEDDVTADRTRTAYRELLEDLRDSGFVPPSQGPNRRKKRDGGNDGDPPIILVT